MQWNNSRERYGWLSVSLHWLMLALLVAVYACIELRELYPKGTDTREALKQWHFTLGLLVFCLVWLRLAARVLGDTPEIHPALPAWQWPLLKLMHLFLYLLMLLMPVAGWVILSAGGKPVPFFGLELPPLVAPDDALAGLVKSWHVTIGSAGYVLIALHTLAALYHHYVRRDNTLRRMLP